MNEKKLNSPGRLRALSFRDAAMLVCIARAYMNLRRHLVGILLTDASASRRTHFRLAVFDYRSIARVFQMYPFGYSRTEEVKEGFQVHCRDSLDGGIVVAGNG